MAQETLKTVHPSEQHPSLGRSLLILLLLWGLAALVDLLWIRLDRSVPSWDLAKHLIGSLNYWWTLQTPAWTDGAWWERLWMLSSKYPPLLYVATAPLLNLLGPGPDRALVVNLGFTAIILGSAFGLGQRLFNAQVGLWAAGLCLLLPRLYTVRLQYLTDYPLTAMVIVSFCSLTYWITAKQRSQQWLWSLLFGLCLGLALLTKQTTLFFLFSPLLWSGGRALWQRQWERFAQWLTGIVTGLLIFLPWSSTNWIFLLSTGQNANTGPAALEGDPPLNTLAAWTYYWRDLPRAVSWPLLLSALVGFILCWAGLLQGCRGREGWRSPQVLRSLGWLLLYCLGAYLLWSAVVNKDHRYIMPYLPAVAVLLAYGLTCWRGRWRVVRWGAVGVAIALMLLNLFPLGIPLSNQITQALTPWGQNYAYTGAVWPHPQIIDEVIAAAPYQLTNLGMLSSSANINEENFNYYGNLKDFQVYARKMGSLRYVDQDLRSLHWFVRQAEPIDTSAEPPPNGRVATVRQLQQNPNFWVYKTWDLPDGTQLQLYRRRELPIQVQPLPQQSLSAVQLTRVKIPATAPPGVPVPVTYEWAGPWEALRNGLVLLTWQQREAPALRDQTTWLHDHGIGLGSLRPGPIQPNQFIQSPAIAADPKGTFQVREQTAMLPPASIQPGTYTLQATYLNRQTGETYPIAVPATALAIAPNAKPTLAPEVDWVTQLRNLATALPQGPDGLGPVFDQIGRLNLYDPIQDYLVQAEQTLAYRLQENPSRTDAYGLALARILQRKADSAIAALNQVVQLDPQNPYAYAYLAFVHLYQFQPGVAQVALHPALQLQPNSAEIQGLAAVASLMQGNLWQTWHRAQKALALSS